MHRLHCPPQSLNGRHLPSERKHPTISGTLTLGVLFIKDKRSKNMPSFGYVKDAVAVGFFPLLLVLLMKTRTRTTGLPGHVVIPNSVFWVFATVCVIGLILDALFTMIPGLHNLDVSASFIAPPPNSATSVSLTATGTGVTGDTTAQTTRPKEEASSGSKWWVAALVIGLVVFVALLASFMTWAFYKYLQGKNRTGPAEEGGEGGRGKGRGGFLGDHLGELIIPIPDTPNAPFVKTVPPWYDAATPP